MPDLSSKEIRVKSTPVGLPKANDFETVSVKVPAPKDGEVVVRNLWMSVDPYMRLLLAGSYGGVNPGDTMWGSAIGEVVESKSPSLKAGDKVSHMMGWREYAVADAGQFQKINADGVPLESYLGVMGIPGQTAYFGLLKSGELKNGENVFVSGASGAVGQVVGQVARAHGCFVVGTAGSDEKCRKLEQDGIVDKAVNYKTNKGKLAEALAKAIPPSGRPAPSGFETQKTEGFDVYFSNVGGEHLEAAIDNMRGKGRIVICGAIDSYNDTEPSPGPRNIMVFPYQAITMRGFNVYEFMGEFPAFYTEMGKLVKNGKVKGQQTVMNGIDKAADAFIGLFSGQNTGKMLVKLA